MGPIVKKSIIRGIIGGFLLLAFYFAVLTLANSFSHAISQFTLLWYWIVALVIGFGIQIALWFYIRLKAREQKTKGLTGEIAATGGISAGSMVACCAHHLIDIAPLLGLSALFLFLAQYQILFLALGILSTAFGIIAMLEIIQKHSLYKKAQLRKSAFQKTILNQPQSPIGNGGNEKGDAYMNYFAKINFKVIKKLAIAGAIIILLIIFAGIKNSNKNKALQNNEAPQAELDNKNMELDNQNATAFPSKTNEGGGLKIDATPIDLSPGKPAKFQILFTTHQGNLDFDLIKQAVLIDGSKTEYLPLEWNGGNGGHHISGTLTFPPLKEDAKQFKLIIKGIYEVDERIFEWS